MQTRLLNIRHLLFGMIILLSGISFIFIVWKLLDIKADSTRVSWISSANLLADEIMEANILLGAEQSLTLIMLRQPEMVTKKNIAFLDDIRRKSNDHIAIALSYGKEIAGADIHHPLHTSMGLLEKQENKLDLARTTADQLFDKDMGKSEFNPNEIVINEPWNKTMGGYIEALATVKRDAFTPHHGLDQVYRDNLEKKEILFQISKFASQERTLIGDAIAQNRSLTEDELVDLQHFRGSIQYNLDRLITSISGKYDGTSSSHHVLAGFLDEYDQLREKVLDASRNMQPYPVDATQWFEEASQSINAIMSVAEQINQNIDQNISYANRQQLQQESVLAGFTILILSAIVITAFVMQRRFFIPLKRLLAASDRIALRKFDQPVDVHGVDELGALGRSFEQMRLSLLFDSCARKQAEEALKDSQKRTRGIVDAAADSIISVNEEGLIMSFNPASETIFGYNVKEIIGREINTLMPKAVAEKHDEFLKQYLLTGKSEVVNGGIRELSAVRKNGEEFPLELAITEINFGIERMFILISRDITQRREIEQALEKAHDSAIEANHIKSEFLAGMSHELRTPLNSIIGFSEMLLKEIDGPMNDEQKNSVHYIEKSGKNLLTLINDILDMSKIEAGRMEVSLEPVDISSTIEESLDSVGILFREKGLILRKEFSRDFPAIQADPGRIRQVMLNLLSNAAKFTDEGEVIVRCHEIDTANPHLPNDISSGLAPGSKWILVSVQDNGFGIAEANIPKVFEDFRQIEGGTSRKRGGTGLGVPISKRFIELHGGKMWLTSTEGHGTTFYFILPIAISEQESQESRLSHDNHDMETGLEVASTDYRKTKVLIIDDDPAVISLCRKFLLESGCQVCGVMLGSEAMSKTESYEPDVILLDIMLPDKDGWQVLEELKGNPATKNIPVIICSVIDNRQLGLSLGAAGFFVKPVNKETLVDTINKLKKDIKRILVIDDDDNSIELTQMLLGKDTYRIERAVNGRDGLESMHKRNPDLVLMNLAMPGMDGLDVLESIKQDPVLCNIPVIVMTSMILDQEKTAKIRDKAEIVQKGHCSDQYFINLITKTLQDKARKVA